MGLLGIRLLIAGSVVSVLVALGNWIPDHFYDKGYEQGKFDLQMTNDIENTKASLNRANLIINDLKSNAEKTEKALKNYEYKIETQQKSHDIAVAKLRIDGLRFKSTKVCTNNTGGKTESKAASRVDEERTERLPDYVAERLYRIAATCQRVQTKLTELQIFNEK